MTQSRIQIIVLGCAVGILASTAGCAAVDDIARQAGRVADDVPLARPDVDLPIPRPAPDLPVPGGLPVTLEERASGLAATLDNTWIADLAADAQDIVVEVACFALDLTVQMPSPDPESAADDAVERTGTDPALLVRVRGLSSDLWSLLTGDEPAAELTRYAICGP